MCLKGKDVCASSATIGRGGTIDSKMVMNSLLFFHLNYNGMYMIF